jgi:hypothetical protein
MIQTTVSKRFNINYTAFVWLILLLTVPLQTTQLPFGKDKNLISAGQLESDNQLQVEADALLPLFENMLPVSVYLKDEPTIKSGTNTERGVAYTTCDNYETPLIVVKKNFYNKANRKQLVNILKHEMTHAWLCRQNLMSGHDERFRRKFAEVDGFGN